MKVICDHSKPHWFDAVYGQDPNNCETCAIRPGGLETGVFTPLRTPTPKCLMARCFWNWSGGELQKGGTYDLAWQSKNGGATSWVATASSCEPEFLFGSWPIVTFLLHSSFRKQLMQLHLEGFYHAALIEGRKDSPAVFFFIIILGFTWKF